MPDAALGAENMVGNKVRKVPAYTELTSQHEGETTTIFYKKGMLDFKC